MPKPMKPEPTVKTVEVPAGTVITTKEKTVAVQILEVTAKAKKFRRGGIAFTDQAKRLKVSDLSPEQVEQIRGEAARDDGGMLVVKELTVYEPVEG